MPRIYNIYHNKFHKKTIEGYENIDITDIDNIVNHSVDLMRCEVLEYFDSQTVKHILATLLNKIRLGGSLLMSFSDIKSICRLYIANTLSDNELFDVIKNKNTILSVDMIQSLVEASYRDMRVSKIEFDHKNNHTYISIERISI